MVQQLGQVHSSDGRTKEQVVEHQRTGSPLLHALRGPVLHGQHGHNLKGLGLLMKWIRPQSYYHWKVAELQQLQHCPHLQGLPVPPGPMEHPSMLQQQQRPSRQGAMAPSTTRNSGERGPMTSEGSGKSSWMEGRVGDGASWDDLVTHAEAGPGASKRKKTDAGQQHLIAPFPLHLRGAGRKRWASSMNMRWAWNHLRKI